MSKILVVYCDGTWNRPDEMSNGRPCPTNVLRLFEATLPESTDGKPQIIHYVEGVGTRRDERLLGGLFGSGISENIKNAYAFMVSNYQPGDRLFLFGFSRGAFTARSIAGLIRNMGILTRHNLHRINEAYKYYKATTPKWHPESKDSKDFREKYTHKGETITFLGVWDTVGALGAPFGTPLGWLINKFFQYEFHDVKLSSIIESAYHALAIDEHRWPFRPCLWELNDTHLEKNSRSRSKGGIPFYEEKWFPGVHSNIGGGYPETGLSDCSLRWMGERARQRGLNVDLEFALISEPVYRPDVMQRISNSQTFAYRLSTLLFAKLPSPITKKFLSPEVAKEVVKIRFNGDYIRRPDLRGEIVQAASKYPDIDTALLSMEVAKKILEDTSIYCPCNTPLPQTVPRKNVVDKLKDIATPWTSSKGHQPSIRSSDTVFR